jgi:ubiquinone/menaquinone biosynthesis C-methylase UbiE
VYFKCLGVPVGKPTYTSTHSPARASGFEGAAGRLAAAVMARRNRDMERTAVVELDPRMDDDVLAVGFGPGVGVQELLRRLGRGCVSGIDPSATMVGVARRRNRRAVEGGQVTLVEASADAIPFPGGAFNGVLAVNCAQLWHPLGASIREVARVLAPGGALVAVTHTWAIEKRAPLAEWLARTTQLLESSGLADVQHRVEPFRSGAGLVLRARKPRSRNRTAPGLARAGD